MPAVSKEQQKAMCMALAARRGDLKVKDLKGAALEIYKSDMTDKQIEDFTVLKEGFIKISEYISQHFYIIPAFQINGRKQICNTVYEEIL